MRIKQALLGIFILIISFAFATGDEKKIVVIDAAHGGKDYGAVVAGAKEKEIVANISKKIKELNKSQNVVIVLLRDDDDFMEIQKRVEKINSINPNLVISLHVNFSKDESEKGIEASISNQNKFYSTSKSEATNLLGKVTNNKMQSRGVSEKNIFVLKNSNSPAIMLELGFLSNNEDKEFLTSDSGQNEIANKILEFLIK